MLLTYELGRRMFSPGTGLLAGIITISTIQVSVLAHAATPDACSSPASMLTFWLFWTGAENGGRRWTWTIGLGCGLAVLAKGPVGLVMPAAIIGYYFLARRQARRLLDVRLLVGLGIDASDCRAVVRPGRRGDARPIPASVLANGKRRPVPGPDGGPFRIGGLLSVDGADRAGAVEHRAHCRCFGMRCDPFRRDPSLEGSTRSSPRRLGTRRHGRRLLPDLLGRRLRRVLLAGPDEAAELHPAGLSAVGPAHRRGSCSGGEPAPRPCPAGCCRRRSSAWR